MESKNIIIQCEHLKKVYNKGKENELEALSDVSFFIEEGEMLAIMGKSGSGKSTLMNILGCLDCYDGGSYHLGTRKIWNLKDSEMAIIRNEKIGIVMQDFGLVEEFSALENVMLPLDFSRKKRKQKKEHALSALEQVEMGEYADQICSTMSGGQKQRVAIARAMINNPQILLADEPTGALDVKTTENVLKLFQDLNKQGMTVLIITHDILVAEKCERILKLEDGYLN